jgi:hypothetical protein
MGSSELNPGDLARIHLRDFPAHGKLGLIVGKEKFYINKSQPYRYTVLLGGSAEIVELHENALEEIDQDE